MTLSYIWCGITVMSLVYGIVSGNFGNLGTAAMDGAGAAVELCIGICGATCLWNGVMTLMDRCGMMEKLSRLLRPFIYILLPSVRGKAEALKYISANMSANLLGIGNAATPMGLSAIHHMPHPPGAASNDMCTLIVLNSASIQLIPITVASVRGALGAQNPFDIIPAVWVTSLCSAFAGVMASKLFGRLFK